VVGLNHWISLKGRAEPLMCRRCQKYDAVLSGMVDVIIYLVVGSIETIHFLIFVKIFVSGMMSVRCAVKR